MPVMAACDSSSSQSPALHGDFGKNRIPLSAVSLQAADSCDSLKQTVTNSLVARYTDIKRNFPYYCGRPPIAGGGSAGAIGAPVASPVTNADSSTSGSGGNPGSTSGTNNQEAGVNEGDILKVDGVNGNIFVAQGQYLLVVDAYPPQSMNVLNQVDVKAHIIALYYDPDLNNILVLTREDYPFYILASDTTTSGAVSGGAAILPPIKLVNRTKVMIYHYLDDPNTVAHEDPQLLETIDLDGYYQDSRRIQGRLHVVTRHYDSIIWDLLWQSPDFQTQSSNYTSVLQNTICNNTIPLLDNGELDVDAIAAVPEVAAAKQTLATTISDIVAGWNVNDVLPQANRVSAAGVSTPIDNYLSCSDVYFPNLDSDLGFQVISSLNTDGQNVAASALVNNSWQSYVSQDNLYLAENNNYWYWFAPTMQQMSIHKVALSASDRPRYKASGIIDGNVGSSFQFSEFSYPNVGAVLRITSTQGGWGIPILAADGGSPVDATGAPIIGTPTTVNHLTLLKDNGNGKLEAISQIRNIAVNESIRSTRFDGKRAFMVTFRQIDPLFTFELSDPFAPRLAGALKITGFSSYIHIYDQNHLLTIGRGGSANGLNGQMQLQLINIADLHNPYVVDSVQPMIDTSANPNLSSYSYSAAEYDHHAFAFFNGNLLAVPVQYNVYDRLSGFYSNFSGVMAYRVMPDSGFELLGKVDHADLAYQMYCPPIDILLPDYLGYCSQGYYVNWASPRRSVFETSADASNVYLYTVSDVGIKAGQLDLSNATKKDITELSKALFPPQRYAYYYDVVPVATTTSVSPPVGAATATTN